MARDQKLKELIDKDYKKLVQVDSSGWKEEDYTPVEEEDVYRLGSDYSGNTLVKLGAGVVGGVIAFAILVGVIDGIALGNQSLSVLEITVIGVIGSVFLAILILKLIDSI